MRYQNKFKMIKDRKTFGGMVIYNCSTHNNDFTNDKKYLNILVTPKFRRAAVAEWLTHLFDKQCPSGFLGSIPSCSVTFRFNRFQEVNR
tara:strand:- start:378 stop:644 length:267 start_codon:yes stop_codon:yes gene_type:complete